MARLRPLGFGALFLPLIGTSVPQQSAERGVTPTAADVGVLGDTGTPAPRRFAMLVGIDQYSRDSPFGDLRGCVADVEAIAQVLVAQCGYPADQVRTITEDPFRGRIERRAEVLFQGLEPQDVVLFFFSGHGMRGEDGEDYLVPLDGKQDDPEHTMLSTRRIRELLRASGAGQILMFLDCCRNVVSGRPVGAGDFGARSLAEAQGAPDLVVFQSCSPGEISRELRDRPRGAYSVYLEEGLRGAADADSDGLITVGELQRYVRVEVGDWARQEGTTQRPVVSLPDVDDPSRPTQIVVARVGERGVSPEPAAPPAQRGEPTPILALPAGCQWVTAPAAGCPVDGATAYEQWVKQHGPVTVRHQQSGIELVWVPGGSFRMGSDRADIDRLWQQHAWDVELKEHATDEQPAHQVELDGFWLGRTEVTVGEWRRVMGSVPGEPDVWDDTHPVVEVSWEDCEAFCRRVGLVLPTEAEWEYAARGPAGYEYPWGDRWDASLCQSGEDRHGYARTAPAGSYPQGASWCGALDPAGNVWEWCRDWYDRGFYVTARAGQRNPECVDNASGLRVVRGGSLLQAFGCRSAVRADLAPVYRGNLVGFRVALPR